MATKKNTPTFAQKLTSLEQIVATLEDTSTSLETSIAEFEQGVNLVRSAQEELSKTEQKVQELLASSGKENGKATE
ncbi:exodeoxyribonuclease VII small subunit [Parahaliea aestuarii]|nr:exodeoxyribonuclease VII small subunit [Parahaliea aestuarii]